MTRIRHDAALDLFLDAEDALAAARRAHARCHTYKTRAAVSACQRRLRRAAAAEVLAFRRLPAEVWAEARS